MACVRWISLLQNRHWVIDPSFFFMRVMTHAIGQTVKPNFTTGIKFAVWVGNFGLLAIPFFVRALIAQATKQCQPQDFP
jgi:hypothetical protein